MCYNNEIDNDSDLKERMITQLAINEKDVAGEPKPSTNPADEGYTKPKNKACVSSVSQ